MDLLSKAEMLVADDLANGAIKPEDKERMVDSYIHWLEISVLGKE